MLVCKHKAGSNDLKHQIGSGATYRRQGDVYINMEAQGYSMSQPLVLHVCDVPTKADSTVVTAM